MHSHYCIAASSELPADPRWLATQPVPVLAVGEEPCANADVLVPDELSLQAVLKTIEASPQAARVLVQVLRTTESLPVESGLVVESLAYSMLQSGPEFQAWLGKRREPPQLIVGGTDNAVLIERHRDRVQATLNRPANRNAISVEMREALIELFELLAADTTIEELELRGAGACFSVGGELREFGLSSNPVEAHKVRISRSAGQHLATVASRVHCRLHGACIGSGIEIPAFAGRITATSDSYFQLPELKLGLIPGAGGCVSIPRRIGRQRTAWLALSGRRIRAQQAWEWGLVDALE